MLHFFLFQPHFDKKCPLSNANILLQSVLIYSDKCGWFWLPQKLFKHCIYSNKFEDILETKASWLFQKLFLQIPESLQTTENLADNQKCQAELKPLYNKIPFLMKMVVSSCFNFRSVKLHISRIRMTRLQTLDNFREKSRQTWGSGGK